jgi:hypothetical protein
MARVSSLAIGNAEVAKLDFSSAEVEILKRKLLALTEAKVTVRGPRDQAGKITYVEVDNVGIQLAATVKALEFAVGKPRQMVEVSETPPQGGQAALSMRDLPAIASKHPQVLAAILAALKGASNLSHAIDVTPTSAVSDQSPSESKSGASPS